MDEHKNKLQRPRFSVAITTKPYQDLVKNTLKDTDRANSFIASITSAVAVNPALQECEAQTIIAGALLGESLNLLPAPQLGQYYLIPFECKVKGQDGKVIYLTDEKGNYLKDGNGHKVALTEKRAQFVLGYKGYIQLAIRSGYYKKINVIEIKESELLLYDPLSEDIQIKVIEDEEKRDKLLTIGYCAMFEHINGFKKVVYWSYKKMLSHADKYSSAFNADIYQQIQDNKIPEKDMWKYNSFWYKNFDDMAKKTLLRQMLGKWGIMSAELQQAFENDVETNEDENTSPLTMPQAEIIDVVIQTDLTGDETEETNKDEV